MKFIPVTTLLLLVMFQFSVIAQDMNQFHKLRKAAEGFANTNELDKSEATYLKAIKIYNHDPITYKGLASLYLKMNKLKESDAFIKLAINNGADISMLLAETNISAYLELHPEHYNLYNDLHKQYKISQQIQDKKRWVDYLTTTF
ncbi:tetratricopeptide repeat protein [Arcticibacter eurypsychrophilus]|uniref:hypothetical protein n=1 Tax=Arcticibacter eurypsychrophilus TaxID=1434752 RepID=UPI00084D43ED|nr:hypothetical protein [Arcticibacter eurypsychrophilus]